MSSLHRRRHLRPSRVAPVALAGVVASLGIFAHQGGASAATATGAGSTIQAEAYSAQAGTQTETTTDTGGGQDVGYIGNGDYLQFANVDFGSTAVTQFSARVASGAAAGVSGTLEVHVDNLTGGVLGSLSVGSTGGWQTWKTVPTTLAGTSGLHTVFLKFVSGQPADFLNINSFTFPGGPAVGGSTGGGSTGGGATAGATGPVRSALAGKCMDVNGGNSASGTAVQSWDCNGSGAQNWTAYSDSTLRALGKCLDATGAGTANGTVLELWDCTGGNGAQVWQTFNGGYRNPVSGRCIDVPSSSTANGARLALWDCNGGANQQFSAPGGAAPGGGTGGGDTGGGGVGGTCPVYSDTPNFGPNVHIYDHSMSDAAIQSSLDSVFEAQKSTQTAQFATRRDAELFKPSTTPYNVGANIGFNTSISGLGQNPDDVRINGAVTVDAFNSSDAGNATQNFWRSAENLSINTNGGSDRWGVAQAAPFRRIHVIGGLDLYPASYGWASGGYLSDVKVDGKVESASQQQFYSKDSSIGSWSGSNWNMVFSGVKGAPATSFNTDPGSGPRWTTLDTTPVSRDVPYLYVDAAGKYRVFVPSLRTNASGASWANGSTPGTSLPMSQFYVAHEGDSAATINTALANGCNVFFTPGVYHLNQTLHVKKANTVVLGIGMATIVPDGGVNGMDVADVDGVRIKGLLFDAGTTNSNALLTVGPAGSAGTGHSANPTTIQDVFFRIGGAVAGKATNSLVVNSSNAIIDHTWAWRADHGVNPTGWNVNTADTGLIVNGNNVLATGLFVEHYQKNEVEWNGQNGRIIFFQNEMPYDVPNQAAWMRNSTTNGFPAIKVANGVSSFEAWGLGSYCFFNVNNAIKSYNSFEVPATSGVKFHDMATVSLGGVGTIEHIINNTGHAADPTTNNVYLVSFP